MAMRRTSLAVVAAAVVAVLVGAVLFVVPSGAATASASSLLAQLPVRVEHGEGYDRGYFEHWVDEDDDGCDTRDEVLIAESTETASVLTPCEVQSGMWLSYYDNQTWTDPSDVDIDHLVPLAEAWASGAHAWTFEQRRAFANDVDFDPSLVAVTDNVNQSKGAKDPAEWLPPEASAECRYVTEWVLVKYRWRLAVDAAESSALSAALAACGAQTVTVPERMDVLEPSTGSPFSDVSVSNPFASDIAWMAGTGITSGYPDGTFQPATVVNRGGMAAFLYRYTKGHGNAPACPYYWFPDVPKTNVFCGSVWWLATTGITTGQANGSFGVGAPVTRQAMAAFLRRYRAAEAPTGSWCDPGLFPDMPAAFCADVTWLASTGITTGYGDGTFKPNRAVTRQEMSAFLHRYDLAFGPSDPPAVVTPPPMPTTTTTTRPTTTTTTVTIPPNPGDTKNCGDFATWSQAQQWFDRYRPYYGDVARLDADGDGIACESLPGAP